MPRYSCCSAPRYLILFTHLNAILLLLLNREAAAALTLSEADDVAPDIIELGKWLKKR